jgi:hypothetical protein
MRRDSRPGQASCCRLVTKRTKFNLHFAFMPPFQIGEKQLGQEVLPSARWNLLRRDTRERSRWIRLERVSIRPWSPSTLECFSPLSHLGSSSSTHASACQSAAQPIEGVVARHTVSQPEKLVEEVVLGLEAKTVTSTAVRPKLGCPPDRRKTAEGKWTTSRSVLPN